METNIDSPKKLVRDLSNDPDGLQLWMPVEADTVPGLREG